MAGRIKLLFLGSTPSHTSRARVGKEAAQIKRALKNSSDPARFEFVENHAVELDEVTDFVVDAAAQVVHFAGHGSKSGELIFEDAQGNAQAANPAALANLFRLAGKSTRLVVLNACYSHDQAVAISEHVDVVIGMSAAIPDPTAIAFASKLYGLLARGKSVGEAFELAKNHTSLQNLPGHHMPQLVHRASVDAAAIFLAPTGPDIAPFRSLDRKETGVRSSYLKHVRQHLENLVTESIHNARFIDLGIADSPAATHLPWVYKNRDSTHEFATIEEAFQLYDRRLLLLGAPGSGKTVTLQHLALARVREAEADPQAPIPLIVNLSKFRFEAQPAFRLGRWLSAPATPTIPNRLFESWLASELHERRVPRSIALRWLAEGRIAAFLDGLDEVNDERRAELAELLNETFFADHPEIVLVICSRIDEYRPLQGRPSTRLQLPGAITLQPFTPAQISTYVDAAGAAGLREALGRDASLNELAQNPLTLSMMTLAYGGTSADSIHAIQGLADQRHHLMESFVARMLQRKERRDRDKPFDDDKDNEISIAAYRYAPHQVNRYLSWLAVRLSMRMQTACALRTFFGFLEVRSPVHETRSTAWIVRLTRVTSLGIAMAIAALVFAPATRAGVQGAAVMLLGACALDVLLSFEDRVDQIGVAAPALLVVGTVWLLAIAYSLRVIWPGATVLALEVVIVSGVVTSGMFLVSWRTGKAGLAWMTAGIALGPTLAIAATMPLHILYRSADTVVAVSMASGLLAALFVAFLRSDFGLVEAAVAAMATVAGCAFFVGLTLVADTMIGELSWQLALALVVASLLLTRPFLPKPTAAMVGLLLVTGTGRLLGGREHGILAGGVWGLALVLLLIAADEDVRARRFLEEINRRFERACDIAVLTPVTRILLALFGIVPRRLRAFIRYGEQALLLKPFSGDIEFIHRRLRDYFALRDLVPRLKDSDVQQRTDAIRTMGFQGVAAIDTLAELLVEGRVEERVAAVDALGRITAPEVAGHLRRSLRDAAPEVRSAVVMNLRNLDKDESYALLRIAIQDGNALVLETVIDRFSPLPSSMYEFRDQLRAALIAQIVAQRKDLQRLARHVALSGGTLLARALAEALPSSARAEMNELLAAPEASVRTMACTWLRMHRNSSDVEPLVALLEADPDERVRSAAADALGWAPEEQALRALLLTLEAASGQRTEGAALQGLAWAAKNRDRDVRFHALQALSELDAMNVLFPTLVHGHKRMREATARALAGCSAPWAVDLLAQALGDKVAPVRRAAAESLGKLHGSRAVEPLIQALSDRSSDVRRAAAESLGKHHGSRAVEPLIRALADKSPEVRSDAAGSLGALRDPRAVEPLIGALADKSDRVRSKAAESLGTLHDPRAVKPLIRALVHHVSSGLAAAESLGALGDLRAVEPLLTALGSYPMRRSAITSLGALGDKRAVEPLIAALADEDVHVRCDAAASLARLRDARAVEPLLLALTDKRDVVRRAAAESLGALADPRAIEPLLKMIVNDYPEIQETALASLRKFPAPAVTEQLAHPDEELRRAAARVLGDPPDARAGSSTAGDTPEVIADHRREPG